MASAPVVDLERAEVLALVVPEEVLPDAHLDHRVGALDTQVPSGARNHVPDGLGEVLGERQFRQRPAAETWLPEEQLENLLEGAEIVEQLRLAGPQQIGVFVVVSRQLRTEALGVFDLPGITAAAVVEGVAAPHLLPVGTQLVQNLIRHKLLFAAEQVARAHAPEKPACGLVVHEARKVRVSLVMAVPAVMEVSHGDVGVLKERGGGIVHRLGLVIDGNAGRQLAREHPSFLAVTHHAAGSRVRGISGRVQGGDALKLGDELLLLGGGQQIVAPVVEDGGQVKRHAEGARIL